MSETDRKNAYTLLVRINFRVTISFKCLMTIDLGVFQQSKRSTLIIPFNSTRVPESAVLRTWVYYQGFKFLQIPFLNLLTLWLHYQEQQHNNLNYQM